MNFRPPAEKERLQAIGPVDGLSESLARALDPREAFQPLAPPRPGDWLYHHEERGQTFDDLLSSSARRPTAARKKICLQPLGAFPPSASPPLERLREFAEAFFGLEVEALEPLEVPREEVTRRIHPDTGKEQLLTGDLLKLLKKRLPRDAYCMLGITMADLYPEPAWNFVFGQASLRGRVGVYSFARYDPGFHGEEVEERERLILTRSSKVLAHETAHMFGIEHCIYYRCLMNGSNHLKESDARPLHLCPVDLRKLNHQSGFDVVERYRRLRGFWKKAGVDDEVRWLEQRLAHIEGN